MLQFAAYLTIINYASCSGPLGRDIALTGGMIYDRNTFMVQATAEIISYNRKLRL
jgi:hypothetical protein